MSTAPATTAQDTTAARGVRPRESAPDLTVPLLRGGTYRLTDQRPRAFTMVVFFRGLHCPVCRAQLTELNRRLGELEQRGIDLIAVSGETRERTAQLAEEWRLDRLPLAHGLTEPQMRAWGLFISHGIDTPSPRFSTSPVCSSSRPTTPSTTSRSCRCPSDAPVWTTC
jgi:peroxiredoxin